MNQTVAKKQNILGTAPVGGLIRKFAIPSIISLLINAVYNITDQIFIGNVVGMLGNAATNVAFPSVTFTGAFAQLAGIGTAAGLYTHDIMNSTHMSIVMPGIFLMGALIQYMGRILGVAGVDSKHYPMLFLIGVINAILAMLN